MNKYYIRFLVSWPILMILMGLSQDALDILNTQFLWNMDERAISWISIATACFFGFLITDYITERFINRNK